MTVFSVNGFGSSSFINESTSEVYWLEHFNPRHKEAIVYVWWFGLKFLLPQRLLEGCFSHRTWSNWALVTHLNWTAC